ncbi:MAG: helix-turn-helix transcriptional regulator [Lachnospiraceae bacterium]|nr:helix-turn-helix transcriptional regulator [Lachnospiraceae bacterium]
MINYDPFWKTLEKSSETWYTLVNKHHINPGTLHRLKHNLPISTVTIDLLCSILKCETADIIKYVPGKNK